MKKIMPLLCLALLMPGTAFADDIGTVRKKVPEFTASTHQRLYDLERCIIDTDNIGKPWVYRQPDMPERVMLVWESSDFGNATVLEMNGLENAQLKLWGAGQSLAEDSTPASSEEGGMEYEYKVIDVADGAISSALLGEGRIETNVMEAYLNAMAAEGWRMVFMANVLQRHLVVSDRETLMITFERRVPEAEREARAQRVIDDIIAAEDQSRSIGRKAAAGAAGLAVGGAVLDALISNNGEA